MSIGPNSKDSIGDLGLGRARKGREAIPIRPQVRRAAQKTEHPKDSVEVSGAAEELNRAFESSTNRELDLSPERLAEVLTRIQDGFYRRPEVRTAIAQRLARVLSSE